MLYHAAGDERRASDAVRSAMNEWRGRSGRKSEDGPDPEFLAIAQSMLGEHAAALATIDEARANLPESRDAFNAPELSFTRSVILVRAGRSEEGYAEVTRLLRVPFGSPRWKFASVWGGQLLVKDDPHYKELLTHPPRL
jgi:hypothetical protein